MDLAVSWLSFKIRFYVDFISIHFLILDFFQLPLHYLRKQIGHSAFDLPTQKNKYSLLTGRSKFLRDIENGLSDKIRLSGLNFSHLIIGDQDIKYGFP